jgi:hypothetical protein
MLTLQQGACFFMIMLQQIRRQRKSNITAHFRFFDLPGELQNQIALHTAKEARPILLPSRLIDRRDALSLSLATPPTNPSYSSRLSLRKSASVPVECV